MISRVMDIARLAGIAARVRPAEEGEGGGIPPEAGQEGGAEHLTKEGAAVSQTEQ